MLGNPSPATGNCKGIPRQPYHWQAYAKLYGSYEGCYTQCDGRGFVSAAGMRRNLHEAATIGPGMASYTSTG